MVTTVATIILAFCCGAIWSYVHYHKKAKNTGCAFKNACTQFDVIETKTAVKRVLNLMLENNVSKSEIKKTIDQELSS